MLPHRRALKVNELAVPGEHRFWPYQKAAPAFTREQTTQGCEDDPVVRSKAWCALLAVEHLQLVAQHEDLDVFGVDAADD